LGCTRNGVKNLSTCRSRNGGYCSSARQEGDPVTYLIEPTWSGELERLRYLEELSDPGTHRIIRQLGLQPGWECLEVGAGAGSIAAWLAGEVAPDGQVVATDANPHFLHSLTNVDVVAHDIREPGLPDSRFDLVHSRFVLEHLPDREAALRNMIRALKPGRLLVLEAHDQSTAWLDTTESVQVARIAGAIEDIFKGAGADFRFGRKLPSLLEEMGLVDVGAEARSVAVRFGSPASRSLQLLVDHLRVRYQPGTPMLTDEDAGYLDHRTQHGPGFFFTPLIVAAWGRKPFTGPR
jgi:SAM-dependent methyltransferase